MIENKEYTESDVLELLKQCRKASKVIAKASSQAKVEVLHTIASILEFNVPQILAANKIDLAKMPDDDPKKDRLLLNEARIIALAQSTREIAALHDPAGQVLSKLHLDNGLEITKTTCPMGVIGAIFESRPNVTIDVAALAIKSGNAAVLRGGTDAFATNEVLVNLVREALLKHDLPVEIITLFPPDRALVQTLLTATRYVDLIIPRGSSGLIDFVRANSKIPTIETGAGVCHTYVASHADIKKAVAICVNAKTTRPAVCNSLDCMIVHESIVRPFLQAVVSDMQAFEVTLYADERSHKVLSDINYPYLEQAQESDFGKEWLDYKCSIKTVSNLGQALDHIEQYSSRHSECIVSEDMSECATFVDAVDAAAVYSNASTRFTDGGVYGLGAEIGISTQKLHARGPFGLDKLVTEKWIGIGSGQIRK